jgi:hypothetical protein
VDCAMAAASSGTRFCSTVPLPLQFLLLLLLLLLPRRSSSGKNSRFRLQSMNLCIFHASG